MATSKSSAKFKRFSWRHLSGSQRTGLLIILFLVAVALPLTFWAAFQSVNWIPRAYGPGNQTNNRPPTLITKALTSTINCRVGQPCSASFTAQDPDETNNLTLAVDFLPPDLVQNLCERTSLPSQQSLTCSFSGTPKRAGEFKLLVTLDDQVGGKLEKVITLNVRE